MPMPITGIRLKKGSLYRGKTNRLQSEKIATDYFFHKSKRDRPQKISFGSASCLLCFTLMRPVILQSDEETSQKQTADSVFSFNFLTFVHGFTALLRNQA